VECIEALLSRRSIRVFRDETPDINIVLKAIDIARYAPSARNSQPWRFIVITDRDLIEKLSELHPHAKPLKNSKIAVVVVVNKIESPTSHLVDGALAAMYFWLALHCLGLGAVWIQTLRNIEEINNILNIPEDYIPLALFAVGYPGETPTAKPRKPLKEIVYLNKFGKTLEM